jgi:hypothetical protein
VLVAYGSDFRLLRVAIHSDCIRTQLQNNQLQIDLAAASRSVEGTVDGPTQPFFKPTNIVLQLSSAEKAGKTQEVCVTFDKQFVIDEV